MFRTVQEIVSLSRPRRWWMAACAELIWDAAYLIFCSRQVFFSSTIWAKFCFPLLHKLTRSRHFCVLTGDCYHVTTSCCESNPASMAVETVFLTLSLSLLISFTPSLSLSPHMSSLTVGQYRSKTSSITRWDEYACVYACTWCAAMSKWFHTSVISQCMPGFVPESLTHPLNGISVRNMVLQYMSCVWTGHGLLEGATPPLQWSKLAWPGNWLKIVSIACTCAGFAHKSERFNCDWAEHMLNTW